MKFERAASFDLAMLEGAGHSAPCSADFPQGGPLHSFEGPLLRDVLKAAGPDGNVRSRSPRSTATRRRSQVRELEQWPVILALKQDGAYLGLGGFGPSWVVFPRHEIPALADRNDDLFVFAIVHIAVE